MFFTFKKALPKEVEVRRAEEVLEGAAQHVTRVEAEDEKGGGGDGDELGSLGQLRGEALCVGLFQAVDANRVILCNNKSQEMFQEGQVRGATKME